MTFPQIVWTAYFSCVGATVGSFLNVCIWRLPRRCLSLFRPNRSMCPSCSHRIAWYDNVPILSFFLLRAKCRHCKAKISVRYPIVEGLTGAMFAGLFYLDIVVPARTGPLDSGHWCLLGIHVLFTSAILVASLIDWDFMIIPDRITIPGMWLVPILGFLCPSLYRADDLLSLPGFFPKAWAASPHAMGLYTAIFGMVMGAGIIYGMGVVGKILFRKEAMGFGDVKFMAMLGGLLGWKGVIAAIVLACLFGSVVGVARKVITGDSYIPFGPFLGVGSITMLVFRDPILIRLDARFGVVTERVAQRLGSGVALGLILLTSLLALMALVRSGRRGPPAPSEGAQEGVKPE